MLNLSVISSLLRRDGFLFRFLSWGLLAVSVCFALLLLALRYWLLPNVEQYRGDIAAAITQAAGQHVAIGAISANWEGLRPNLVLRAVQVYDKKDTPALMLDRVESTLSWLSLLVGEIRFHEIEIERPDLVVRRDAVGVIYVAGIALNQDQAERGFSDWLLRQNRLIISDAGILWQDEQRGAPPLQLKAVSLRLENDGKRHRFGLRATPPRELAAPLDVRGDFAGESVSTLEQWRGQLFAQLDYADIAAWRPWLSFPKAIEFNRGAGALRMWIKMDGATVEQLTADVYLQNVRTRLAEDRPELDLIGLQGRVGWKKVHDGVDEGFEISTRRLSAAIRGGLALQPVDFLLQTLSAHDGKSGSGKLSVNALDLGVLIDLAEYLPISKPLRERLNELSPRGGIHDMQAKWNGWNADEPTPARFSVKGRFANLGMKKFGGIPAFNGVSGNIDGSEKGGTFNLNSQKVSVELLEVFREPLALDTLTAQASWDTHGKDSTEFKFSNISFANSHAAGSVYGSYRPVRGGPGVIDLAGSLTRADARHAGRYMPLVVNQATRDWVEKSVVAGESSDVRLRLKGDLTEFPFTRDGSGIFQVSAKASKGVLDYVDGWPGIGNISADLLFQGSRMEINASQANIFGARLSKVKVRIPDMAATDELLEIEGEAQGATGEFLKFVAKSPVDSYTDGVVDGVSTSGNGKLLLKLIIPLQRLKDIKLAGSYQFIGNQINPGPYLPNLEKLNAKLEFTESSIKMESASAQTLGGPVTIHSTVQPGGGVRVTATGKANLDNLRKFTAGKDQGRAAGAAQVWTQYLHGSTDWRAVINFRNRMADVSVESSLQGISSDLPAPFAKAIAEVAPLRFERKATDLRRDVLNFSYGKQVAGQIFRLRDAAGDFHAERGVVSFGATSYLSPAKAGILINGSLPLLELDQWRGLLTQLSAGTAPPLGLSGIDLHIGALDFLGRRFNDTTLNAGLRDGEWRFTVASREISGDINWRPQGKGRVVARLKSLIMPDAAPAPAKPGVAALMQQEKDLPALDVVADNFVINEKQLGKLELIAVQQEQNWRVEKLRITNSDSSLSADGLWQSRTAPPRIQANVKLEASDIGKFLTRFGYPDGVKRGSGKLEGAFTWSGGPQAIDYPSLSGNFKVEAQRGQFVKLEPGIGKLLGILSLQALPRRITLDFRDVFSEGFEFDEISGNVKINRGIAVTDDLRIEGSAAKVAMSGEVNLVTETQKLRVKVLPALGQGVSLAGTLLGGPVVGITAMILSKILQDPFDQLASYEYNVTGTWVDPIVAKVQK